VLGNEAELRAIIATLGGDADRLLGGEGCYTDVRNLVMQGSSGAV
jgi:hypothetical protein